MESWTAWVWNLWRLVFEPDALTTTTCRRTPIDMAREGTTLKCPVLQLVGQDSSQLQDTLDTNVRLNPATSDWIKVCARLSNLWTSRFNFQVADSCGMVLEDQPGKCTEAIILFLQGQGYCMFFGWNCINNSQIFSPNSLARSLGGEACQGSKGAPPVTTLVDRETYGNEVAT